MGTWGHHTWGQVLQSHNEASSVHGVISTWGQVLQSHNEWSTASSGRDRCASHVHALSTRSQVAIRRDRRSPRLTMAGPPSALSGTPRRGNQEVGVAWQFRSGSRLGDGSSASEKGREEECLIARPDPLSFDPLSFRDTLWKAWLLVEWPRASGNKKPHPGWMGFYERVGKPVDGLRNAQFLTPLQTFASSMCLSGFSVLAFSRSTSVVSG